MRKMRKILLLALGLFLLVGCFQNTNPITFSYNKTNYRLDVGDTEKLFPIITNLANTPSITYTSGNEAVVIVEQVGNDYYLRAVGAGSTTVTARLNNVQGKMCTLVISVVAPPTLELTITGESAITLEVGDKKNFVVTSNIAYDAALVWSSSDESVGTITSGGLFTALAEGTTTIIAAVGDATDEVTVNVVPEGSILVPTSIELFGESQVAVGETITITFSADVEGDFAATFSSSVTSVASVNQDGVVTGLTAGTTIILVSLIDYPSVVKTKTIQVVPEIIEPEGITISGATSVNTGASINLTASITPTGATGTVVWSSENDDIATVDQTGKVIGVSAGTVTVTASLEGNELISNTYQIVVNYVAPSVTKITINGPSSVQVGAQITLTAEASPEGASNEVTWMSLSGSKASITSEGVVTGVATGTVTITAISKSNTQIIGYKEIEVTPGPSISAIASATSFYAEDTITVTGTVINSNNTGVTYSSNNLLVATVDAETGVVTGVSAGAATIIATADVSPTLVATVDVTVLPRPTITLSETEITVSINQEKTVTATVTNLTDTSVTWSTSAATYATVDQNGKIKGIAEGTATITATANGDQNFKATVEVNVVPYPTITMEPTTATVVAGKTITVTATVHNSSNTNVSYSSSNTGIATVNSSTGVVTGVAAGEVTITATAEVDPNLKATCQVTVSPAPKITMTPTTATINQNETVTLTAIVENLSNTNVSYSSSDPTKATVGASTGVVTGVAQGNVTITATAEGDPTLTATSSITVNPAPTITVAPTSGTLAVDATLQLTATVSYSSNTNVTWSTSNQSVATVSSTGLVTAVAQGEATITATAQVNTNLKATCQITVNPANYTLNYTLNGGSWSWSTGTVGTVPSGSYAGQYYIDGVSNLPEIFMQDFYKYLKDNNLLSSSLVDSSLRVSDWAGFSVNKVDPQALYNWVSGTYVVYSKIDGYSQFFWNSIATDATTKKITSVTGGFFGTEPYQTKYKNLLETVHELYRTKEGAPSNGYSPITTENPGVFHGRSAFGFILDGYFYGTQTVNSEQFANATLANSFRSCIPTPTLRYYESGSARVSAATTYQITSYPYGQVAILREPFREGYVFEGWYDNSGLNGSPVSVIAAGTAPAAMYYAKWTAIGSYGGGSGTPTSITISAQYTSFAAGTTSQLSIVGGHQVTWSGEDGKAWIATVNETGLVSGVSAGTIIITATLVANPSVKATIELTITPGAGALTVKVQIPQQGGGGSYANPSLETISHALGSTAGYYQVHIWDANQKPVSRLACNIVSSNTSILTVSTTGDITTLKTGGPVTITVTHKTGGNVGTVSVTVVA